METSLQEIKELEKARKTPKNKYISHEELKKKLLKSTISTLS